MSDRFRRVMFWFVGPGLLVVLLLAFAGLPRFGHLHGSAGDAVARVEVKQRHATEVVTAIVLDYRGFDTLVEETVLFAAAIGIALLLRPMRGDRPFRDEARPPAVDDVVGFVGRMMAGPVATVGLALVANGQLTPGGGFQGGVVVVTSAVGVWLMLGYRPFQRLAPIPALDVAESLGVAAFSLIGMAGLAAGARFLSNVLPFGRVGSLLSGGLMPILNVAVGLAVGGGILLIVAEFVEQTVHGRGEV